MRAGDAVLYRSVYRGNVRWCFPHQLVEVRNGCFVLYCQPGNRGKAMGHDEGYLVRWAAGDPPHDHVWQWRHVLWLVRPQVSHALGVFWDEEWRLTCWYVNLQAPLRIRGRSFDTCDLALDVLVRPDGSWTWKDEDEFAHAIELGILGADEAAELREEGERVVAAAPWPTGWEDWRPPPDWAPLELPDDWHLV